MRAQVGAGRWKGRASRRPLLRTVPAEGRSQPVAGVSRGVIRGSASLSPSRRGCIRFFGDTRLSGGRAGVERSPALGNGERAPRLDAARSAEAFPAPTSPRCAPAPRVLARTSELILSESAVCFCTCRSPACRLAEGRSVGPGEPLGPRGTRGGSRRCHGHVSPSWLRSSAFGAPWPASDERGRGGLGRPLGQPGLQREP